tara:strand:+ start:299 stop:523 length:225 start_codon:yes stop_codon:yes gene_type:complete
MNIKNKIHALFSRKRETEKKIEELQNACKHHKEIVKFVILNEKDRQASIRWVCEECEKTLRIPSEKEIKTFISK